MTKVERHRKLCEQLNAIYAKKNHDYGDSFHTTFLEEGMTMPRLRLSDKLNRFKQLSKADGQAQVKDESIRDTLMDLANYALMTVLEMDEPAKPAYDEKLVPIALTWEGLKALPPHTTVYTDMWDDDRLMPLCASIVESVDDEHVYYTEGFDSKSEYGMDKGLLLWTGYVSDEQRQWMHGYEKDTEPDDEEFDRVAKRVLNEHKDAFKKLAKS